MGLQMPDLMYALIQCIWFVYIGVILYGKVIGVTDWVQQILAYLAAG